MLDDLNTYLKMFPNGAYVAQAKAMKEQTEKAHGPDAHAERAAVSALACELLKVDAYNGLWISRYFVWNLETFFEDATSIRVRPLAG